MVVGCHKDGISPDQPWHQSWEAEYEETARFKRIGFSDSGPPQGSFEEAHVQITIEIR